MFLVTSEVQQTQVQFLERHLVQTLGADFLQEELFLHSIHR